MINIHTPCRSSWQGCLCQSNPALAKYTYKHVGLDKLRFHPVQNRTHILKKSSNKKVEESVRVDSSDLSLAHIGHLYFVDCVCTLLVPHTLAISQLLTTVCHDKSWQQTSKLKSKQQAATRETSTQTNLSRKAVIEHGVNQAERVCRSYLSSWHPSFQMLLSFRCSNAAWSVKQLVFGL